ncbi:uncharacterized protein N7469_006684 [Penicillium citrinum]|uniref:Probable cytosolic iron-sulfur protein assembly protein 1 n=1 Tax=Penicillium citrinum TaxID=5077 RepID=A0A9W9NVB0_PENCI|nr:uncharacterized protein N7469_006684 [Penicillium citrinum]KAJ5226678.1 hypothetical protein N7469_006684 [Penicillium citrinum]
MSNSTPNPSLILLSPLTPPSLERTWLTAPHPTLPIVATCSTDKTVRIYSLTNFTLLSTITGGHKRSVRTAAWKPHITGESVLATGSFDATVGIWRRWDTYGQTSTAAETSLNEDTEEVDDEEWRFAVLLDGHDSEVKSVSWSPSGMLLATCARDKSIWIWEDLDDGDNNFETVAVMQEHSGDVKCVSWHPVEECLASGGYDDTIRLWREDLDDWGQVACIKKHEGTVWFIDWEGTDNTPSTSTTTAPDVDAETIQGQWREQRVLSGPRLISCSDDRTVRVWRRLPKEGINGINSSATTGIPSIIRPTGSDENWEEDAILPHAHELAIYAVAWSRKTGLVASVGADGRIVIYEERFVQSGAPAAAVTAEGESEAMDVDRPLKTEWVIVSVLDGAHGIYEINHAAWAKRADRGVSEDGKDEEVLITTADDGSVKVWTFQR